MWNLFMPKQLFRFERLIINRKIGVFQNLKYFPQVLRLYLKYLQFLEDDFSLIVENVFDGTIDFVEKISPHFYLVLNEDEVCGFFCLENFVGKANNLYSAEVVTCFDKKYWGTFTKYAGQSFKDFCFDELALVKLKALVYPQNTRVRAILRECGFSLEAVLKMETLKEGVLQDLEIYSAFNQRKIKEVKCS